MDSNARPATWRSSLARTAVPLGIVLLVAWAWAETGFDPAGLGIGLPRLGDFLARMVPPDLTIASVVFRAMLETVQIAVLGTALGAALAVGFGLLAAANLTPGWVHQPVKWTLGAVRGIPVILLALMFVSAYGLGPLPGVAAIALHSAGMLGKFLCRGLRGGAARPGRGAAHHRRGMAAGRPFRRAAADRAGTRPRHSVPFRTQPPRVTRPRSGGCGRGSASTSSSTRARSTTTRWRRSRWWCWRWWCWWSRRAFLCAGACADRRRRSGRLETILEGDCFVEPHQLVESAERVEGGARCA